MWLFAGGGGAWFLALLQVGFFWEPVLRPSGEVLEFCPVKACAWVCFAARGDVFGACDVFDWVVRGYAFCELGQGLVLGCFEGVAFESFEFDADGVVVAIVAPAPVGCACVPCAVVATDELLDVACALYDKVG